MAYKTCECCGEQFEPNRSNQKYCSKECRSKSMNERHITKIRASCTPTNGKSLLEWCNENGERSSLLLSEYSSKNELTSEKIPAGSHKIANWVCSTCGYEWDTVVRRRTSRGGGCPSCAGHILETNNLYLWCMNNGERGQRILSEYSSKNELTPEEIAPMSNGKVWWKCSTCGHEWIAILATRVGNGTDCPSCAGFMCETNNLYLWCMNNGERGQRILSEYSSKNELTAKEIAPKARRKVYWVCSTCGYEWVTVVAYRVPFGTDCPKCDKTQTSYGEQILYYILQRELKEHKVLNRAKVEGYEVDVFVPDLKFGIEYSGYTYHADKIEHDMIKREALKVAGYNVITILEKKSIDGELYCDFSFIRDSILNPEGMLNYLKSYMKENYGLDIDVSLSGDEKEVCKRNSAKQYIDIDEVVLLKVCGKSQKESGKRLGVSQRVIGKRLKELSEDELAQKEENIECVYRFTRFGDSAERIASDFELDLDFVKKIQDLIKKYENGYKAPEMEESTLEVEEGDNNNEEESISNFDDGNDDDEFIWL